MAAPFNKLYYENLVDKANYFGRKDIDKACGLTKDEGRSHSKFIQTQMQERNILRAKGWDSEQDIQAITDAILENFPWSTKLKVIKFVHFSFLYWTTRKLAQNAVAVQLCRRMEKGHESIFRASYTRRKH